MQTLGHWQKKYVNALRSGKFQKTTGVLCRVGKEENCYCALGIMCELARQDNLVETYTQRGCQYFDHQDLILPSTVVDLFRTRNHLGQLKKLVHNMSTLQHLNDLCDLTFPQLADLIEQDPENFFMESA